MTNMTTLFALATAMSFIGCGDDNHKTPDAAVHHDSPPVVDGGFPAAPALGAQIDRLGRPAINTALNHTFDVNASTKGAAKNAYNADQAVGTWPTTNAAQFAKNLAFLDALDDGLGSNGGCGNQALYNGLPGGGGNATAGSYLMLAGILADDQLYLDTTKSTCTHYLAVEFGIVTGATTTTCGGRAPSYDVIDVSLSMLAMGLGGFDASLNPLFPDGVPAHTDITDGTFPFLGAPH
jgi:hypothetical protein